ncbi:MAG: hypothetical protein QW589_03675 [Candidatus Bathyarchaeia archaeon]
MSAKVEKYGRIVLPKSVRENIKEGRLIVCERKSEITLIPVVSYKAFKGRSGTASTP